MTNFELGRVLATRGIADLVSACKVKLPTLEGVLRRHTRCDWGDLCDEDKQLNDLGLKPGHEGRLFSSYKIDQQLKVWIITESDRSVTTMLLPDEY